MKHLLFWFLFVLVLSGCESSSQDSLPKQKPNDFAFSLKYGVRMGNELNTFDHTYTKDLINDGSATTIMELSDEELDAIYELFQSADLFHLPTEIGSLCSQPYEKYDLTMIADGEEHNIEWNTSCDTEKLNKWNDTMNHLHNKIIYPRDEYQELPETNGGYL
ncbi:putative periplasmic lipoprotein [Alkalicoccobacillus murimartini]|uniref:ABC-type multidrug transport system fused ATPase/permease subunit n=1 Tax=Alkalicoccobacillus murimartini TaxID=171685 RepID=A0ABT9YKJ9_9BACI|nr:hypothetical protein [Alkalicoccobacillus murimartini]MDQ0208401.1 ABC-type multidrug transport system fused ATPase/permease subunit [Alkalicoccobacillus murimartini]